eukprot:CAMPEP_0182443378 /NCGR_PEP_ID=MMETSP1172-20130603/2131_1 /TAXON_ID=708627 /ORGANISM="Timspurckia oligopyrenoides, Strain CCMP3278" /LENGTH=421 /DNA_ID=CAMNT_0024638639 /DNA_START=86 /DNA_END=1351 /DNA_ORIENTATION=-
MMFLVSFLSLHSCYSKYIDPTDLQQVQEADYLEKVQKMQELSKQLKLVRADEDAARKGRDESRDKYEHIIKRKQNLLASMNETVRDSKPLQEQEAALDETERKLTNELDRIKQSLATLESDCQALVAHLPEAGFDDWLENRARSVLSPVQFGFLRKTRALSKPMMQQLGRFTKVELGMARQLGQKMHLEKRPLLSGLVVNVVLLFPLIFMLTILAQLWRWIRVVSVSFLLLFDTVLFLLQSITGLVLHSAFPHRSLVANLRSHSDTLFMLLLFTWSILLLILIVTAVLRAMQNRTYANIAVVFAILVLVLVGINSVGRPALLEDEEFEIGLAPLLTFCVGFGFIGYLINQQDQILTKEMLKKLLKQFGIGVQSSSRERNSRSRRSARRMHSNEHSDRQTHADLTDELRTQSKAVERPRRRV